MKVIIDGVEYAPRHTATTPKGKIKSLAALMAEGRAHKHLTMAEAAAQSGCTINQVDRAEAGAEVLLVVFKLAKLYGIPTDQLARAVLRE